MSKDLIKQIKRQTVIFRGEKVTITRESYLRKGDGAEIKDDKTEQRNRIKAYKAYVGRTTTK